MTNERIAIDIDANVGVAAKNIEDFSKRSRIALTNLSLVVQDLPFGFIGIQNNLPFLVQNFQELVKTSNGVGGALKNIGKELVGPAGLFFAFSAVTSLITVTIQKYGSLANAVNVLTSSNKTATESQILFNKELSNATKETGAEGVKIGLLIQSLSDLSKPLKERQAAYFELKKIQPDIVAGITQENALTAAGVSILNENAKARKEYIKLKAQESAISAILNQNAAKELELNTKVLGAAQQLASTRERISKLQDRVLSVQQQNTLDVLIEKERIQTSNLIDLTKQYNNLIGVSDTYANKLDPILGKIAVYDFNIKQLNESLKTNAKNTKDAADSGDEYVDKIKGNTKIIQIRSGLVKELNDRTKDLAKENSKLTGPSKLKLVPEQITSDLDKYTKAFEDARLKLGQIFFDPLRDAFTNFLDTGKFTFEEFSKTVINSVKRIIAQLAATQIVNTLAKLVSASVAATPGGGILSALTSLAPNFGSGQNFNSFSPRDPFGGNVNFVLRGSDLIGSINRTNAQINRVG